MTTKSFHQHGELLKSAYQEEKWTEAEKLAHDYLKLAEENPVDWNYGNAVHQAHLVLAKVNLERNDLEKAKEHFLKSAETKGSPQMKSFGPNLALAKEFLQKGEKDVVAYYLVKVKKFWNPLFSYFKLRKWQKQIRKGKIPNFGANVLYYLTSQR